MCRSVVECYEFIRACRWIRSPVSRERAGASSLAGGSSPVPIHSMPDIFMLPELPLPDRFLNPSFMPIFFHGLSVRFLGL